MYSLDPTERKRRGLSGREFALNEGGFTGEVMGNRAVEYIDELLLTWRPRKSFEIINATKHQLDTTRNTQLVY